MKRVLVSGASGVVGYGILRSLRLVEQSCFLIGTTIYTDSIAPAFCDQFELAPATSDPNYIDWLLDTLQRQRIDMLIPGIEVDVQCWLDHEHQIRTTGALPLLNQSQLITLCQDKWKFYQALTAAKLNCAIESSLDHNFESVSQSFGLPFLLKPRRGYASKGIVQINSREEFDAKILQIGPLMMAQPIIGTDDEEYTVSAFCDGKGSYWASMALRRKLAKDGYTGWAQTVDAGEFSSKIEELCRLFQPIGPTNFQFRRTADGLKLLEINPRISSSTYIRASFGYNESAMALNYFLDNIEPTQPDILRGSAVRYTDEKVFYETSLHI